MEGEPGVRYAYGQVVGLTYAYSQTVGVPLPRLKIARYFI
jgi:hypothetical protein